MLHKGLGSYTNKRTDAGNAGGDTSDRGDTILKKLALAAALVLLGAAALLWLRANPLDLDALRSMLSDLDQWRVSRPLLVAAVFFAAYVMVSALSLPFATWMSLLAGALFGFGWGLVLVSCASAIGASFALVMARYLLRDLVQARFGPRLAAIDDGIARDGAYYLFTLRLVPVVPFVVVNLLMGLTAMKVRSFYWVSQLGMLPGTAVVVNAGTQLAALDSPKGILSLPLIVSFALLGFFPWIAKAVVAMIRRRRIYAGWSRPARFDRNLIVIGAGAAGLVSAYIGAAVKARVTLVERHEMGGDCLNYGCVPSKALIRSAKVAQQMRDAGRYGMTASEPQVSFRDVFARVHAVIASIAPHDSVERYRGLGVEVLKGDARLVDPWTVDVTGLGGGKSRLTSQAIIIATGAAPLVPELPGLVGSGYLTSDTMWAALSGLDAPPERMVILGGGPVGCELAQAFARLGSRVSIVEMADSLLADEDRDVSDLVTKALAADGVEIFAGHKALAFGATEGGKWLEVEARGERRQLPYDQIIVAVGRVARLQGFGLEELGIPADRVIETNEWLETRYPNILAAGDVAGPFQFTHVAAHQAWFAAINGLFGTFRRFRVDYRVIPRTTFVDPEVARVGLNEREASERKIAHEVTRYDLADLDRAIADGSTQGFVKVLTVPGKDTILGATIIGERAGDMLAEFVLAMKHGIGLNKVLGTIHSYPTYTEANRNAAGIWRSAHVSARVMALLERFHHWRRG